MPRWAEADIRVLRAEGAQQRGDGCAERFEMGEGHLAVLGVGVRGYFLTSEFQDAEGLLGACQQAPAVRGELDAPPHVREERDAELFLQTVHGARQRRLADAELRSGVREVFLPGNGRELDEDGRDSVYQRGTLQAKRCAIAHSSAPIKGHSCRSQ